MTQHSGPSRAPRPASQPKPAKLAPGVWEEGKFWRSSSEPPCRQEAAGQGGGAPGSGARNNEARRDVSGPAGRRTLSRARGARLGPGLGHTRPRRGQGRGRGTKRLISRGSGSRPAASPRAGVSLAARRRASRIPAPRPGPPDRPRRARLPLPQALTRACRPKPLRSSSEQAAGRARPGRGPRVPRKPQAAQVEPGRRHRKSRVSSLPFLRGDRVTGKREVSPTAAAGALSVRSTRLLRPCSSEARAVLPAAAAGGGRVHRDPGGGREEGPAGGRAERLRRAASAAGAEQSGAPGRRPHRPPRGALRRPVGEERRGAGRGALASGPRAPSPPQLSLGSRTPWRLYAPLSIRARRRRPAQPGARTLRCWARRRRTQGAPAAGPPHGRASGGPASLLRPGLASLPAAPPPAHGSASREEKRLPSVPGGRAPRSSPARKPFPATLGGQYGRVFSPLYGWEN